MPRYQIVLPDGTIIVFGWDPSFLGFFVTVTTAKDHRRLLDYDGFVEDYDGLPGLLRGLVAAEVVTQEQLEAGLNALLQVNCTDDIPDEHERAVATIVHQLKQAAGE